MIDKILNVLDVSGIVAWICVSIWLCVRAFMQIEKYDEEDEREEIIPHSICVEKVKRNADDYILYLEKAAKNRGTLLMDEHKTKVAQDVRIMYGVKENKKLLKEIRRRDKNGI